MICWDLEVQWLQIIHLLPLLLVLRHILQSLLSHPLLQISAPQASVLYITRYWKLKLMSMEIYELNLNHVPNVHRIFRSHGWPSKCNTTYKLLHHLFLYVWSVEKTWNKFIFSISKHFHISTLNCQSNLLISWIQIPQLLQHYLSLAHSPLWMFHTLHKE